MRLELLDSNVLERTSAWVGPTVEENNMQLAGGLREERT